MSEAASISRAQRKVRESPPDTNQCNFTPQKLQNLTQNYNSFRNGARKNYRKRPLPGPVAKIQGLRGMARAPDQLLPIPSCDEHDRLHPRARGSAPVQPNAEPHQRKAAPHRLWRLLRGSHAQEQVSGEGSVQAHEDAGECAGGQWN